MKRSPRKRPPARDPLFNSSVGKALALLETFGGELRALNLAELAAQGGMTTSSAQRCTHTLARLGYLMLRFDYPRLPVVIALVLGSTAERNFHQSLMIGDGSWSIFADRPIALILSVLIAALLCWPPAQALWRRGNRAAALAEGGKP